MLMPGIDCPASTARHRRVITVMVIFLKILTRLDRDR
jgi:hypothetical protein